MALEVAPPHAEPDAGFADCSSIGDLGKLLPVEQLGPAVKDRFHERPAFISRFTRRGSFYGLEKS